MNNYYGSSLTKAFQYRAAESPIHGMGVGWKILLTCVMSAAAFAAREPWSLAVLLALNIGYYRLGNLSVRDVWKDTRLFLVQIVIVVVLYVLRFGAADGFSRGICTGVQILLFFMPGAVFLRTTNSSQIFRGLKRFLPPTFVFVIFTSLRFVPYFAREFHEVMMMQRLRGAPLTSRHLLNPKNWSDVFHCLMIPMVVRALKTAQGAALSAEARGFGVR